MAVSVCPVATVYAPAEVTWALLDEPEVYAEWWDVHTDSVSPPGSAHPGQEVLASTRRLGFKLKAHIRVDSVDPNSRELNLTTSLPFGITVINHIKVIRIDGVTSRVSFG